MSLDNNNNKKWKRINSSSYFSLDYLLLFSYFPFSFLPSLSFVLFLFPLFHSILYIYISTSFFFVLPVPYPSPIFLNLSSIIFSFFFLPALLLSYLFILSIHFPFSLLLFYLSSYLSLLPVSFSSSFIFPLSSYLILLLSPSVFHWKIAKHILKQVLTFIKYSSFVSKMESSF